jgi:hypothetical protein
MKRFINPVRGVWLRKMVAIPTLLLLVSAPVRACTIFVLTDTNRVLFCNNEDWTNPITRIWFIPPAGTNHGGVYVGFDDGWAQGGMNTEGLAYDWVAGYDEIWKPDTGLPVFGNPSQQMLETCTTIQDAIAFYRGHQEPSFSRAKILIADRTGASARIGAKNGTLQVEPAYDCRGFGYGEKTLDRMLTRTTEPTVANGFRILRASLQKGMTKYANIFDLKSGDISLYPFPDRDDQVKFDLATELKKGGHYYDMPQILEQLTGPPRPLLANMKRVLLDGFKPIPDQDPKTTEHTRALFQDAMDDTPHATDFTPESWKRYSSNQKQRRIFLKSLGELRSVTLVDRRDEGNQRHLRYRVEFQKASLLYYVIFDEQNRHVSGKYEDIVWKGREPGA